MTHLSFKVQGVLSAACSLLVGSTLCCAPVHAREANWTSSIIDPALRNCILDTMSEQDWVKPEQITKLKCHSMDIQSLAGLDKVNNLSYLSIYNNHLSSIDINLSSFPNLQTLNIARNNLNNVNLERLSQLEKLYVFDNGMENLRLSKLPNLQILKANNNKLVQFEYSDTPSVEKVYIFNNQLETINIYDLPALTYMDCRQNPMPDELYDEMDKQENVTYLHDGNAEDWN